MSLTKRFALASFVIILGGMFGVGAWVAGRIEDGVITRTASTAALYVDSFVAPHVQELQPDGQLPPERTEALNGLLQGTSLGQEIRAFKVWGPGGRVIFSTDAELVGQTFPIDSRLARAWEGEVAGGISSLDAPENALEREREAELLEVYAPVRARGSGEVIAVAEFYQTTDELRDEAAAARRESWLVVGAAAAAMYLLLAVFVKRMSTTISGQQSELSGQVTRLTELNEQNAQLTRRVRGAAARTSALNERLLPASAPNCTTARPRI
jgi:hypothetical protein